MEKDLGERKDAVSLPPPSVRCLHVVTHKSSFRQIDVKTKRSKARKVSAGGPTGKDP